MGFLSTITGALSGLGGPLISGAASLLGGAMSQNASAKKQAEANAASQANAREQMAFQAAQTQKANEFTTWSQQRAMDYNEAMAIQDRDYQSDQSAKQMAFQTGAAQKAMDYEERMSNSAHQREVADLRAAGLNPILSGTGGMGSTTPNAPAPSGAMGHGSSASVSGGSGLSSAGAMANAGAVKFENILGQAVSTGYQAAQTVSQIANTNQDTENKAEQTIQIIRQANLTAEEIKHVSAKIDQIGNQMDLNDQTIEHLKQLIKGSKQEVEESIARLKAGIYPAKSSSDRASARYSTSSAKAQEANQPSVEQRVDVDTSMMGKGLAYFDRVMESVGSAIESVVGRRSRSQSTSSSTSTSNSTVHTYKH